MHFSAIFCKILQKLCKTKNFPCVVESLDMQLHIQEQFSTLLDLQHQFYEQYPQHADWNKVRNEQMQSTENLQKLTITIPPKEMREIFELYGVIALRRLENPNLLFFCGNAPLYCVKEEYSEGERSAHQHEGHDTAEFNLMMNPSCVVHFPPNLKAQEYLCQHPYKKAQGENMSILNFRSLKQLNNDLECLAKLLEPGGTSKSVHYIVPGEFTSRIDMQSFFFGKEPSLWAQIYRNSLSPSWYLQGIKWLISLYAEEQELQAIQELAQKHGLIVELSKKEIRDGVRCGTTYHKYPRPICDLYLKFTKQNF